MIEFFSYFFLFFFRETGESFLEPCPNNKRDRKTLETLILKRVRLGTKILTDGWSGYKHLEELGIFLHCILIGCENCRYLC